jgi:hypothetical protein
MPGAQQWLLSLFEKEIRFFRSTNNLQVFPKPCKECNRSNSWIINTCTVAFFEQVEKKTILF